MSEIQPPQSVPSPLPAGLNILPIEKTHYFNGFEMGLGQADIIMTLKVNDAHLMTLNCSFTTAKTILDGLSTTLKVLEESTGRTMLSIEDMKTAAPKMQENMAKRNADRQKSAKKKK